MAKTVKKKKPTVDMADVTKRVEKKIKRASEFKPNLAMVIYARPKVGKTRFCASAPKVLIIDCDEKGTDSTRDDLDPKTIRIETWSEVNDIYWYLKNGDHDFESVAIDTVSGLQTLCLNFVLGDEAARDASRDPDMPSRQVWGKVGQLMRVQITNFRNLPMNVIFTAHTRTRDTGEGEDEVILMTGPNVTPGSQNHLLGAVGLIGYMTKREVVVKKKTEKGTKRRKVRKTRLFIGPSDRFETGVRYSALKDMDYLDSPTFGEIYELVTKKKGAK